MPFSTTGSLIKCNTVMQQRSIFRLCEKYEIQKSNIATFNGMEIVSQSKKVVLSKIVFAGE